MNLSRQFLYCTKVLSTIFLGLKMHELSIAQSIIATVLHEMKNRQLPSVKKIVVRIGELSGVFPDALQFGYEAIVPDTPLRNTTLEIQKIPLRGKCNDCSKEFDIADYVFVCPACHSVHVDVVNGYEMDIAYLEVEESSVS